MKSGQKLASLTPALSFSYPFFNSKNDHLRDLGVDGWITLGWISRRWDVGIWTELGWPRIGKGGGRL